VEAGEVINPKEKVITWKIGDYILIKKIDSKKVLKEIEKIRRELEIKNELLSDEKAVEIVKEARDEWGE